MAEEIKKPTTGTKKIKRDFIFAVGRRRSAVARVRLYATIKDDMLWGTTAIKKGDMLVNQKPISEYFKSEMMRHAYSEPFRVANAQNRYTITIQVAGGGPAGQLAAVIHGIAGALSKADTEKYRSPLKKQGFLTRDARVRERRKVGMGGKARRKKQSPKR